MNRTYTKRVQLFGLLTLAGCLFLSSCATRNNLRSTDLSVTLRYSPDRLPMISAHRGGGMYTGYPENCLESFAYLAGQMSVIIECDIAATKDSALVMMHDDTYDR